LTYSLYLLYCIVKNDDKLTCYTEVIVYRTYGRYEDPAQPIHTRVWRMLLPFKITNQSRAEAIGRRRPNFCRVIHL
jgi:hypothetical protein